jgi:hypothetical protein
MIGGEKGEIGKWGVREVWKELIWRRRLGLAG